MIRGLLGALVLVTAACGGSATSGLTVGKPAPAFKAVAIDGTSMALEDLAGEPRILVFWATWCGNCMAEIPVLEAIEAEHSGRVVSISLDEGGAEDVRPFLAKRPLPYTVLLGDAELFARYDGLSIPHTVVLDADLRVVAVHRGTVDQETLDQELASL